jgi:hypothetical protein
MAAPASRPSSRAAGRVYDPRRGLDQLELLFADQVARVGCEGGVQADEVGALKEVV